MCGIAGIIHKDTAAGIGNELTLMLQSMNHRGPDSTGFAVYGTPRPEELVVRFKLAEQEDLDEGFEIHRQIEQRRAEVDQRIASMGGEIVQAHQPTEYAFGYRLRYEGDRGRLCALIEEVEGAEILSLGRSLELIKDLGSASSVSAQYSLESFTGTHGIGHVRMATESDVDICSAHPFWAYPFSDISVVHNGQLTNYWGKRRDLERLGRRFVSDCDSELIAVYVAHRLEAGDELEEILHDSVEELDGVFTYLVATADSLGMAKDVMAAKPMVLYEGEDCIAMASEEVAIRSIFLHEIDTVDPYAGEVRVWHS